MSPPGLSTSAAALSRERLPQPAHHWTLELLLRLAGAALQILATLAVTHALTPQAAGVYFRGVVMALGLSTLLRGKYEIYMAHHIIGRRAVPTGYPDGLLLMQLSGRMLLRSAVICGILLVLTADLDISAPQLQADLQTYLPFVLALPFLSLSALLGEALRAANRTLGIVVAAYAVNASIVLAVVLAPPDASLALYSWAFLLGSVLAAAAALLLARHSFPGFLSGAPCGPLPADVLRAVDARELISLVRGALLWGPPCVLALWAPAVQMAQYAVAQRTALLADFFLPAWTLTGHRETLLPRQPAGSGGLLLRQLGGALLASTALVAALLLTAPATLSIYGSPYDTPMQITVYGLLLGVQWLNGLGRPAVRCVVARWDERRIGAALVWGAVAAVLLCCAAVAHYGALAVAAGAVLGALIVNGRAILMALGDRSSGAPPP